MVPLAVATKRSPLAVTVDALIAVDGKDEYARLVQAVVPSPILYLAVSVSKANSPAARVGLADVQAEATSRRNCIFTAIR